MKKIGQFLLAALCTIFMMGQALALDGKLFSSSTSPERWVETLKLWEKDGILVGENLAVEKLYQVAKTVAVEDKHPAAELSDQAFAALMARRNPGLPATGSVKAEMLRFMAQGNGIYLPTPAAVAALRAGDNTPAPALRTAAVASSDGVQAVALTNMEAQVRELKAAVEKSNAAASERTLFGKRLDAFAKQLATLQGAQAGFAKEAELAAVMEAMQKLQAEVNTLPQLRADVEGLKAADAGFETRLSVVEERSKLGWANQLTWVLLALALLLFAMYVTLWRRGTSVKVVAEEAKVMAEEAKGEVKQVRAQAVLLDISLPEFLEQDLRLLQSGEQHQVDIIVDGERFPLTFIGADNAQVKVLGIKGQHNPIRIDRVVWRIKRAAGHGDLVGANDTTLRAA